MTKRVRIFFWGGLALLMMARICVAQEPVLGSTGAHDPSTMIKCGSRYYIFSTGQNISSKSSADKITWSSGPSIFSNTTRPSWTTNAVPGFTGNFWAPDVIFFNGLYHVYYSVSTFGSQVSAIGLVTNPTLDPTDPGYQWTDQGPVIQSNGGVNYNAIDPSLLLASNGRLWMTFGSFWTGIKMVELDPATGLRSMNNTTVYSLATHPPSTAIEGSCLIERGNYFYLFVNWDTCCAGVDSTYNIRVGRSATVTGPYLDRNGVSLASGGGILLLETTGRYIGPGHAGVFVEDQTNWFTYHYYDGNAAGSARLGIARVQWSNDGWPIVTNDWCAFYPFEADAREDLGQFNGQLNNGATIIDDPARGHVLELDGVTNSITLPLSVANASTFAAWVKWNGGVAWQRIFDFGSDTTRYFFLTPAGANNRMRFAITTGGLFGERTIDAPAALPSNSWCHVAVVLDGASGKLYLNGSPVATNANITLRPWQVKARTNYLGRSQYASDPPFNGQIDSFRIYGRALSDAEILHLAEAHPSLAHRYSFIADASDSIGTAHGTLLGNAVVTNNLLVLPGVSGSCVNLPGGIITNDSAVTIEFWAAFGTNGSGTRVFDFGRSSGGSGAQYMYFSPHTSSGTHRLLLSTTTTTDLNVPGTLDGQSMHVVCIVDPSGNYCGIYTNGVLDAGSSAPTPALNTVSGALSYIGRSLFSSDSWLNSTIDEFRIYHGRLAPEEIAADFAAGPDVLAIPVSLNAGSGPGQVQFSWPSYAAGFVLQSSPSINSGAVWNQVSGIPAISNGFFVLPVTVKPGQQYFRLKR